MFGAAFEPLAIVTEARTQRLLGNLQHSEQGHLPLERVVRRLWTACARQAIPRRASLRETDLPQEASLPSGNHILILKPNSLNKERLTLDLVLITSSPW